MKLLETSLSYLFYIFNIVIKLIRRNEKSNLNNITISLRENIYNPVVLFYKFLRVSI